MTFTLKSVTTTTIPVSPSDGDAYYLPTGAAAANPGTAWETIGDDNIAGYSGTFSGWIGYTPDGTQIYQVEDQPASGSNAIMLYLGTDTFGFIANSNDYASSDTWYVAAGANHSDDNNSGLSRFDPFETIGAALTAASAASPTSLSPHNVCVLDGEKYVEDITIPDYVQLYAPNATLAGSVRLGTESACYLFMHTHAAAEAAVDLTTGKTQAEYRAETVVVYSSSKGFQNTEASGQYSICVGTLRVAVGAIQGVGGSASDGSISGHIGSIHLNANSMVGVMSGAAGGVIALHIGRILDRGFTTTKAISVSAGTASLVVGSINADTAYDVSAGTLNLSCLDITGTETHSGGTLNLIQNIDHAGLSNLTTGDPHTQYVKDAGTVTDHAIVRYDGTDGRTIQNSAVTIDDTGGVSGWTSLTAYGGGGDIETQGGDLSTSGGDANVGSGGITETSAAVGYILEHNGTKYKGAIHHPIFQGRASSQTWDGTTRYVQWDTEDLKDSGYTHSTSTNPEQITVGFDGVLVISVNLAFSFTVVGIGSMWIEVDTGGGFAAVTGSISYGTASTSGGRDTASIPNFYVAVSNGDILRIAFVQVLAGSGTTVAGANHICIQKVRAT